jgi:hypothetical protein
MHGLVYHDAVDVAAAPKGRRWELRQLAQILTRLTIKHVVAIIGTSAAGIATIHRLVFLPEGQTVVLGRGSRVLLNNPWEQVSSGCEAPGWGNVLGVNLPSPRGLTAGLHD